ncbi:MAG: nucleotide exchange factor GrpE [Alphaproteobacteria bacterium]|nr:nucleotide exchange factor GrpE [Alphaproteobacteria bacterium]
MSTTESNETPEPQAEAAGAAPVSPEIRIAELEAALAHMRDEQLRALAEVENVRRRGERQVQEARLFAIDRFARDLLQIADSLGKALEVAPATEDPALKTLIDGVAITEKTLLDVFARHGLARVGAKGEKFDPNIHNAVAQIPSEAPVGAVAEVFQPGYTLAERTLRAAMVAVSLGGGGAAEAPKPAADQSGDGAGATIDIKV